jgi:hypothetical protein
MWVCNSQLRLQELTLQEWGNVSSNHMLQPKQECAIRQGCLATRDFFVHMYCNILLAAIYCIGLSDNGWSYQCIVLLVSPIIPIHCIDLLRWQNSNTLIKNVKVCIKNFFYCCSYDVTWLRSTRCSRYLLFTSKAPSTQFIAKMHCLLFIVYCIVGLSLKTIFYWCTQSIFVLYWQYQFKNCVLLASTLQQAFCACM